MNSSDESGFTLLEVLVALVILVFALAALYQAMGSGLQASVTAEREWQAAETAETVLAELGRSRPLRDGVTRGALPDGRNWTLRVDPFEATDQEGPPPPVDGHLVTVEVSHNDGRGPNLRVRTLVLGVRQ